MRMTVASVLSHLVVRLRLFYEINENKSKRKINIDLAVVASQIPGEVIHDSAPSPSYSLKSLLAGTTTVMICLGQAF